jgi:AcrR family transcriptional regulator
MSRKTKEEVLEEFRCTSIQDAAMAVIARKGIDEATIQEIADEAGIAKGTVYVYFRDRDELLSKTTDRAFDRLLGELESAFKSSGSFANRLMAVALKQLQFFDENGELFRATMALSHRHPEAQSKPRTGSFGRYVEQLEKMFADAKQRGEIRDLDPHELASVYRDCIRGVIIRRIEHKSRTPPHSDATLIVQILLRGIQASGRNKAGEKP